MVTTFNEMRSLAGTETTVRSRQLESPQEVVGFLEVGTDGVDFVDQIFHTDDVVLAEGSFNDGVISEGNALLVDLSETTLVNQLADALQVGSTVGNVGINDAEHVDGSLGELDKDTVVDLVQAQELQNLAGLGAELVDTLDADDKGKLGGFGNVEGVFTASQTTETDFFAFSIQVFLNVAFGALEDFLGLLGSGSLGGFFGSQAGSLGLFDSLALLQDVKGDSRDGAFTNTERERERYRLEQGFNRYQMGKGLEKGAQTVKPFCYF